MSTRQAAEYLGISVSWLNKARTRIGGPIYCKVGSKVIYQERDLQEFLDARLRSHTGDHGE
jgi:hypothetical protein